MKYAVRTLAALVIASALACPMMNRGGASVPETDLSPTPTPKGAVCHCNTDSGQCGRVSSAVKLSCSDYAESLMRACPAGVYMPECFIIVFACWGQDICAAGGKIPDVEP